MGDYLNVHELFAERLLPFIRHMVQFFSERFPNAEEAETNAISETTAESLEKNKEVSVAVTKKNTDKDSDTSSKRLPSTSGSTAQTSDSLTAPISASPSVSTTTNAVLSPTPSTKMPDEEQDDMAGIVYCGENLGKIQVAVLYSSRDMVLTLKIIQANQLVAKDFSGTSDPYVKILLLPDKRNKLTTKVKRKNLNPRWNETFLFEGFPYTKLLNRTIYLQVLDYDRFSRDDPIGEVCLPLCELQLSTTGQTMWKTLEPCKGHQGKLGELLVSLNYKPSQGVISIGILMARNLKAKDINGQSDPYVKVWLMYDGKKVEKRKTGVKEKCLNPVFQEEFSFLVPYDKIRHTSLFISVMDYDRMGRNELIGQILLGSKSGPMEIKHWNEMFCKSKMDVQRWHMLKNFS